MSDAESFDLTELADHAGVTPRTVRYYIQQGLLPSPGLRGPGARYERGHLDRLRLIRRLQREHLPLAEIRRRLEALDDDAVRALLETPAAEERGAPSSALEYVRDVLGGRGRAEPSPASPPIELPSFVRRQRDLPSPPPPPGAAIDAVPLGASPGKLAGALRSWLTHAESPPRPQPAEQRSQWERITLAPDVELHIRRPLSREQNRMVERLLDAARELFRQEEP